MAMPLGPAATFGLATESCRVSILRAEMGLGQGAERQLKAFSMEAGKAFSVHLACVN